MNPIVMMPMYYSLCNEAVPWQKTDLWICFQLLICCDVLDARVVCVAPFDPEPRSNSWWGQLLSSAGRVLKARLHHRGRPTPAITSRQPP
jgi:hypothetical protein